MKPINHFHFQRTCLDNGLVLLISENQRVPLLSVHGYVLAGTDQNPPDQPGAAFLTASLLDEGTQRYDFEKLAALIEDTGGSVSIFSQREASGISLEMKSEDLSKGLELLAEMLCRPVFPKDRFSLETEKILNQIQAMDDDPQAVASRLFDEQIYRGCPLQYPILGTQESIRSLCLEEVRDFHCKHYAPQSTVLVVVGAADSVKVGELVAENFSRWHNSDFRRTEIPPLQRQTEPIFEEQFMDKEQINIFLGHLGIERKNPDYYALQVMDMILGSGPGFTSRIPRKLRDEQGLAYTTYSDISGSSGVYPGQFVAYVSTSPQNRQQALDGLLSEIEGIVEGGITSEELEAAHDFLTGNFVFEFQSNASVARFLLGTEWFDLGVDYVQQYPRIIRSITQEQVNQVAQRYLETVNYTTVVVGPRE